MNVQAEQSRMRWEIGTVARRSVIRPRASCFLANAAEREIPRLLLRMQHPRPHAHPPASQPLVSIPTLSVSSVVVNELCCVSRSNSASTWFERNNYSSDSCIYRWIYLGRGVIPLTCSHDSRTLNVNLVVGKQKNRWMNPFQRAIIIEDTQHLMKETHSGVCSVYFRHHS